MFCCKYIKALDCFDISLKMLGSVAFAFFVITIWPSAMIWVHSVNPWFFLITTIILMAIPYLRASQKGKSKSRKIKKKK